METIKESPKPKIVPKIELKGKDGREAFADKIDRANEILKKAGLPKELKK